MERMLTVTIHLFICNSKSKSRKLNEKRKSVKFFLYFNPYLMVISIVIWSLNLSITIEIIEDERSIFRK